MMIHLVVLPQRQAPSQPQQARKRKSEVTFYINSLKSENNHGIATSGYFSIFITFIIITCILFRGLNLWTFCILKLYMKNSKILSHNTDKE